MSGDSNPIASSVNRTARCPLTYRRLNEGENLYSSEGLRLIDRRLKHLEPLPSSQELRQKAVRYAERMSIGGVQRKVGATLRPARGQFEIVESGSQYILKPSTLEWKEIPENEDLTMRLASTIGIPVPLHGLLHTADHDFCYFIRRFDRVGTRERLGVEDFGQILGFNRDEKYRGSIERIIEGIESYTSFPLLEKHELFRRILFAFLTGNNDMHLKNFSIITDADNVIRLSPLYDQVNTTIFLRNPDELALPLRGKQKNLTRNDFLQYLARERLGLNQRGIDRVLSDIQEAFPAWEQLIAHSFLSTESRTAYRKVIQERRERLQL